MPKINGLSSFTSEVLRTYNYKSSEKFRWKRVLVVGCGNFGIELSLDLSNHNTKPSMVVCNSGHVLPREFLGKSTFELAVQMMKWLPFWLVDKLLLIMALLVLRNVEKYGLKWPEMGPLELKNTKETLLMLDVGALEKIRTGDIKVVPGIKQFSKGQVELVNGEKPEINFIVLATSYCSNVSVIKKKVDDCLQQ